MSNRGKHNPVKKYLQAKEFVEYCKANNIDASLNNLEVYEKGGLLNPVYRLVTPDEYVRAVFEYNHRTPFNPNTPFDVDNKWREITSLINSLSSYTVPQISYFEQTLKNGHPLDFAWRKKNPFLYKPPFADFKPWEEYKIVAGTIDRQPIKEETAKHYYATWQIFIVDELKHRHTIEDNYATGGKKGWGILKKDIHPSELLEYFELFQTISNFRMMESLIWLDITFDVKQSVIEGKLLERLTTRTKMAAKKEYQKHSHAEWIKFIRKLVELNYEYLKREKIKLSKELKRFLSSTISMIMDATEKPFWEISNEYDGKFKGLRTLCLDENIVIYPGGLERIFPDELKQVKKHSLGIIESYIRQLNDMLPDDAKLDPKVGNDLIDSIIGSSHWLTLSHLYEIHKAWFNRRLHWKSSIWAHIRSFAVSIESIGQEWYNKMYLSNILEVAFAKDYTNLRDSLGGNKITDAKTPGEYKQKLDKIRKHRKKGTKDICGHHLVVAHLTRNYLSHTVRFEPDMLGSIFLEVYKDLVLTLISLFVKKPANHGTPAWSRELQNYLEASKSGH